MNLIPAEKHYDRRGLNPKRAERKNTCAKPRERDGKNLSGGKHLRRAKNNLGIRIRDFDKLDSKIAVAFTKPGSMKK